MKNITYSNHDLFALLLNEENQFLSSHELSPEESAALHAWVLAGNSVYSNPWLLSDESGGPESFVAASRIIADLSSCQ